MISFYQVYLLMLLGGISLIVVGQARAAPQDTSFADLVSWGLGLDRGTEDTESETLKPNCNCVGPRCDCCLHFNMSYVDLGGPGCVNMEYISPHDGFNVNVSYSDNQLISSPIRVSTTEVATASRCVDLLSKLAQICAKFHDMSMDSDGKIKTCVALEPTLLGDIQDSYHVGCFEMNSSEMRIIESQKLTNNPAETIETSSENNSSSQGGEDALIAAVNESAEEGIAWFSSLLGFSFGGTTINETVSTEETTQQIASEISPNEQTE